jgi:prepilin-type N-terminal cleavage/methylation domain-containing protein
MTFRTGRTDAGFTLIEVLTSLAVIGVVMTAVTTFFVRSMVSVDLQGSRQAAIQLASDGMERLREMPGSSVYAFLQTSAATSTITANGVDYQRTWSCKTDTGAACQASSLVIGPTVTVTWPDKACAGGACKYSATTLISTSQIEPIFDPAAS